MASNPPSLTLGKLPSSIARTETEVRGEVRGSVAWARTAQRRIATADPTLFVCTPTTKRYDTPTSRLVKYALTECARLATRSQLTDTGQLGSAIWRTSHTAQRLLRHPKLADTRALHRVDDSLLTRVERRRPDLQPIVDFARLARAAFDAHDTNIVSAIVEKQLLVP